MIINASTVGMGAKRTYAKTEVNSASTRLYRGRPSSDEKENNGVSASISNQGKQLAAQKRQMLKTLEEEAKRRQETARTQNASGINNVKSDDEAAVEMMKRLLEMLKRMRELLKEGKLPSKELLDLTTMKNNGGGHICGPDHGHGNGNGNGNGHNSGGGGNIGFGFGISTSASVSISSSQSFILASGGRPAEPTVWMQERNEFHFVSEREDVTFSTTGVVQTADGRTIGFNVDLELSRDFMECTDITEISQVKRVMTDPLVINLDNPSATVSDMKFRFDLNADGVEDDVSYLNSGSGFLALDKNNDGKINDGTELFGAQTGNGFKELAAYDSDKNGWIDEADDIYDKLTVWIKTADGTDKQLSLKEANVGAIYLGSVSTDYSLTDRTAEEANAQIRRTGVFLKESGEAGTIQHVDFAI